MEIETLPDEELAQRARSWRRRALHGEKDARDLAHRLEVELRRRFGTHELVFSLPEQRSLDVPLRVRPWWKVWPLR